MISFTHNTARLVLAVAALCAALVTAARADDVAQVRVKYADLDVTGGAGAAVLYQRIKVAAVEVCGGAGERDLTRKVRAQACVDRAIAQAVATVNAPAVSGLRQTKVGGGNARLASLR